MSINPTHYATHRQKAEGIKNAIEKYLHERSLLSDFDWASHQNHQSNELANLGFNLDDGSGILIMKDKPVVMETRRLRDLLHDASKNTYVYRSEELSRFIETHDYNPILYRAVRNILPPRIKSFTTAANEESFWYADLVVYRKGILPTHEPFRSIGHWNTSNQIEIFQALDGVVGIITAERQPTGNNVVTFQKYAPGDLCIIPPGAWHLTYVLNGPATVINLYTERNTSDRMVQDETMRKYARAHPVEIACLVDANEPTHQSTTHQEYCLTFSERAKLQGWKQVSNEHLNKISSHLFGSSLASWFVQSSLHDLIAVEETLWTEWQASLLLNQ